MRVQPADLYALATGLCWALATPGRPGAALTLLGCALASRSLSGALADDALRGLLVGLVWLSPASRWILPALSDYGVAEPGRVWAALVLVQAPLLALPWALASLAQTRATPAVAMALAWTTSAWLLPRLQPFPVIPADLLAVPELLGPAIWGGPPLLLAVAFLVGGLLPRPVGWVALAAWVLLPSPALPPGDLTIALVQPGWGPMEGRQTSTAPARIAGLQRLIDQSSAELIVLPEAAWPEPVRLDRSGWPEVPQLTEDPIIIGAWSQHPYQQHLVAMDPDPVDHFAKVFPTPVGESPVLGIGRWQLWPGDGPRRLDVAGLRLGPMLCFEDLMPSALTAALDEDPDLLLLSANDAWSDGGPGTGWHLQHARLIAAASGRYVLRPTISGITSVIDPHGRDVAVAPPGRPALLTATVAPLHPAWTGAGLSEWIAMLALVGLAMSARRRAMPPDSSLPRSPA